MDNLHKDSISYKIHADSFKFINGAHWSLEKGHSGHRKWSLRIKYPSMSRFCQLKKLIQLMNFPTILLRTQFFSMKKTLKIATCASSKSHLKHVSMSQCSSVLRRSKSDHILLWQHPSSGQGHHGPQSRRSGHPVKTRQTPMACYQHHHMRGYGNLWPCGNLTSFWWIFVFFSLVIWWWCLQVSTWKMVHDLGLGRQT